MEIWCVGEHTCLGRDILAHKGVRLSEGDIGTAGVVWDLSVSSEHKNLSREVFEFTYRYPAQRCRREKEYLAALQGLHLVRADHLYAVTSLEWSRRPLGLVVADRYIWLVIYSRRSRRIGDPVARFVENSAGVPLRTFLDALPQASEDSDHWHAFFLQQLASRSPGRWNGLRRVRA